MKYCGIGSRKAPRSSLEKGFSYAVRLASIGVEGLSGGASGMDDTFERGAEAVVGSKFTTFIPFSGFRERSSHEGVRHVLVEHLENYNEARYLASQIHPYWGTLSFKEQQFHARNCYEILDIDLNSPVDFVILSAPVSKCGKTVTGGTNTAFQLAKSLGVKTFNLMKFTEVVSLEKFVSELENNFKNTV